MVNIDFWYKNSLQEITRIDLFFNGYSGLYEGNIYINDKIVGDYSADDSIELERTFSHLHFNWN